MIPWFIPMSLICFWGKNMTFRVKVQPNFGQTSVWKLSVDEDFVKQIKTDYITDEV